MKVNQVFYILICLVIGCLRVECQADIQYASSARNLSLGNAGVAISGIEGIVYNPAGVISVSDWGVSATVESRFVLSDLTSASLVFVKNIDGFGAFGVAISNFGIEEYKQQKYGFTYARPFSKSLSIGIEFDYFLTQIDKYGSSGRFGLAGGVRYEFSKQLQIGISTANYLQDINGEDNQLNSRVGVSYRPGDKVWIHTDVSMLGSTPKSLHVGMEYTVSNELVVRLGTQTSPTLFSVGIGYALNQKYRMNGATSSHQNLGVTPAASFIFENKR